MKETKFMRNRGSKALALGFALIGLACGSGIAQQQRIVELINFTGTPWRYVTNGADLGTAWSAKAYVDSGVPWLTGSGLLGYETTPAVYSPYVFNTSFTAYTQSIITYYFRTHFTFYASNFVAGLSLVATNFVDDGCVIYLNGAEVGRLRVPSGQNYLTLASGGPAAEGTQEILTLSTNSLMVGDNVIAVEVHNVAASSDIVYGMDLVAIVPVATAIAITTQPQSQTVTIGGSATLTVGISGGPASYQWQKETFPGSGVWTTVGTASSFTISPVASTSAGNYRVIVSNSINSVTSAVATLTVGDDRTGPRMLRAYIDEGGTTNNIIVEFDERLLSGATNQTGGPAINSAVNPTNYTVTLCGTTNTVSVTGLLYIPGAPPTQPPAVRIRVSTNNWSIGCVSNYCLMVNNIRDNSANTNIIAPNSQIAIGCPIHTNLVPVNQVWHFNDGIFEPDIYTNNWYATNFVEGDLWGSGVGVFVKDFTFGSPCIGTLGSEVTEQEAPQFFRTWFNWPANSGSTATLNITHAVDDGAIFYLNGVEILRYNLPSGTLTAASRATVSKDGGCVSINVNVNNLRAGTNLLAVGVYQFGPRPETDFVFGMQMDSTIYRFPTINQFTNPPPRINFAKVGNNGIRMSWTNGPGYALITTTNITKVGTNTVFGPWVEVQPDMANPFTNNPTLGPVRFYRLSK